MKSNEQGRITERREVAKGLFEISIDVKGEKAPPELVKIILRNTPSATVRKRLERELA